MTDNQLFEHTKEEEERVARLHDGSIVVDGLIATDVYLSDDDYKDHLKRGGVTAANVTVASYQESYLDAIRSITEHREKAEVEDNWLVVEDADDIREGKKENKTGLILGFQDTAPIGNDLWKVGTFSQLGVRIIQLTYNEQNYVGCGCCERHDPGLSEYGYDLIDELNKEGILIDLSHCGDNTTEEAIKYSDDPVSFTHVGLRHFVDAPGRNKTDEQIQSVADGGGVVGLTCFPPLVKRDQYTYEVEQASIHDILDAIDHAVDLVGVDHVGIGTDINDSALDTGSLPDDSVVRHYRPTHPEVFGRGPVDKYDPYPEGFDRHTNFSNLTHGLVHRGYSDTDIKKILGGNFLRLFEEVWDSF